MFSLRLIVRMGKLISLVRCRTLGWEPKNNGPRFYKISVSSRFWVNNRFRRDKNGIIVSAGHLLKSLKFAEKENTYQEFSLEAIIDHPSKLTFWNYLRPPSWFWVTSEPKIDGIVPAHSRNFSKFNSRLPNFLKFNFLIPTLFRRFLKTGPRTVRSEAIWF